MYTNNKKGSNMRIERMLLVITIVMTFIALALGALAINQLTQEDQISCQVDKVTVSQGDTVWGIAQTHCPEYRLRTGDVVSIIIDMNGNSSIHPNQVISLPYKKGDK
jgi:cell division protein YceG involved in septum cleavage